MSLLEVSGLSLAFGPKRVVDDVSFEVARGETLALVGTSGSGKTLTALALLGLEAPAKKSCGTILYEGREVRDAQTLRGKHLAMVFQEPASALNPVLTVGEQVAEVLWHHLGMGRAAARARVVELFTEVGLPNPAVQYGAYPFELSGGQRQRVVLAMALAANPALLIADEPTSALDVTIGAQIVALLKRLQRERGMAMLFITHDLALLPALAERTAVMVQGRLVAQRRTSELFGSELEALLT